MPPCVCKAAFFAYIGIYLNNFVYNYNYLMYNVLCISIFISLRMRRHEKEEENIFFKNKADNRRFGNGSLDPCAYYH